MKADFNKRRGLIDIILIDLLEKGIDFKVEFGDNKGSVVIDLGNGQYVNVFEDPNETTYET